MLEIICWPTILVVDPQGVIVSLFEGEIQASFLDKFIPACLKFYDNNNTSSEKTFLTFNTANQIPEAADNVNSLNFPTKVCMNVEENILFISDSGNNRILAVKIDTRQIEFVIGNGKRGLVNGSFENAEFDWPQGLILF